MLDDLRVFALPLKRAFRGVTVREGIVFRGPNGWAEFAPFTDHSDAHAGRWLTAAFEQAFGVWPTPVRDRIPVNAIIPIADAATTRQLVDAALAQGCTTIKTKVGGHDFDADVERVATIRTALDDAGVDGAIRIDTNQQWSLAEAIDRIGVLDAIAGGLEYVEQPVAGREDLLALRRSLDVRIAVDESVRMAADPSQVVSGIRDIADVVVLKSIPLGGVQPALRLAERIPLPVVVSGSLDTSVGLASGLWLAGSLPDLPLACGLATGALFEHDIVDAPQQAVDGTLRVQRVVPDDPDPLGLVDEAKTAEWRARLERAWTYADTELVR